MTHQKFYATNLDLKITNFTNDCSPHLNNMKNSKTLTLNNIYNDSAEIASKLKEGAGSGSIHFIALSSWLSYFWLVLTEIKEEMTQWMEWLANILPPFTTCKATMVSHLITMDEIPVVWHLGIRDIFHRLLAKLWSETLATCMQNMTIKSRSWSMNWRSCSLCQINFQMLFHLMSLMQII